MTVAELKKYMKANGYLADDITPKGRVWLRSIGIELPTEKTLLRLGLETVVDEVLGKAERRRLR